MLTQIFKSILLMSAAGSVSALLWLCLKPVTRKLFSPKWQYYIWLTVLIVMILPIRLNLPKKTEVVPNIVTEIAVNTEPQIQKNTPTAAEIPQKTQKIPVPQVNFSADIWEYLSAIWLFGAILVFAAKVMKYILFLRAIHKNSVRDTDIADIPKRLRVYRTDMLDAPLIVGIIRPKLFLPDAELSDSDLSYILMHELTHYRRNDILYKWFAAAVQSVHWFNPIVYAVSRQIDSDCEISCDYAVTRNLTESEQHGYMKMILDLLANSKSGLRPLTTQMASEKRTLKRRFTMIKTKKTTSKFMSALSAVLAVVILSATVFASGIMQNNFTSDGVKYEVYNGDNKITLKSEPFIYGSEYYLPLRDILNGFGVTDISYTDGKIDIKFPKDMTKDETEEITLEIGDAIIHYKPLAAKEYGVVMRCGPVLHNDVTYVTVDYFEDMMRSFDMQGFRLNVIRPTEPENYYAKDEKVFIGTAEEQDHYGGETVKRIVVDENGETVAVIPVENQISENVERKLDETGIASLYESFYQMFYGSATAVYDFEEKLVYKSELEILNKDDKNVAYVGIADIIKIPTNECNAEHRKIITNTYEPKNAAETNRDNIYAPENIVNQFFASFGKSDFESMKKYCTQSCIDTFFQKDGVYGMKKASLTDVYIDPLEFAKSSNGFNVFVTVDMVPHEMSVFDPRQTSTSFYVILERQSDGRYLINEFVTGL